MTYKHLFLTSIILSAAAYASDGDALTLTEFTLTSHQKSPTALQPLNVSIIDSTQIEESAEASLLPILSNQISGLFVTERGFAGYGVSSGAAGLVNIRGVGQGNKVLFLLDGQPQWAGIYGHAMPDTYVANGVARVDVVKGPASLIYGSNAMGGAINITTRRAHKEGKYAHARAMFGSFSTQRFDLSTGMRSGKWQANAATQLERSNGNRSGSNFWEANEFIQAQYTHNHNFEYGSSLNMTQSMANFPGTEQNPLINMWTQIYRYTAAVYAKNHFDVADGSISAYINHGNHKISDGYAPTDTPIDTLFRSTDYNFGVMLNQNIKPWLGANISAGASFQRWGGHVRNGIRKGENEVGVYALMQQSLWNDILSLNAGVRLQHGTAYGYEWIPQAGFTLRPFTDSHVRFAFTKGFRSPNLRELYIGTAANAELDAEYLYNYELELRKLLFNKRLDISASLFFIDAKNMIQTEMIDGRTRNMNVGAFRNKGIEANIKFCASAQINISANYSYLHTSSYNLLYAPKNMLNAEATYRPGKFAITAQSHSVWHLNNGASKATNYSLLNLRLAYHMKVTPIIKLDNITNKHYQIIYGCPMPGTTILAGISIAL